MPLVSSPQFLHCLTTSLKHKDSLLFEQAQRCVRRISDLGQAGEVDTQTKVAVYCLACIQCLAPYATSSHGSLE